VEALQSEKGIASTKRSSQEEPENSYPILGRSPKKKGVSREGKPRYPEKRQGFAQLDGNSEIDEPKAGHLSLEKGVGKRHLEEKMSPGGNNGLQQKLTDTRKVLKEQSG